MFPGCAEVKDCMQTTYEARRLGFGKIAAVVHELVQLLLATGCSAVLDMDDICQRESLEVIGRVCFGIEFGALRYCLVCPGISCRRPAAPHAKLTGLCLLASEGTRPARRARLQAPSSCMMPWRSC